MNYFCKPNEAVAHQSEALFSTAKPMEAGDHFKNGENPTGKGNQPMFDLKKGLLLALCFIAISCACFAQDIIIMKDARRINAKVLEVNVDNVRYKNFDNQDGPTYTLLKNDIATIIYPNGQVETFASESPKPTEPVQAIQTPRQTTPANNRIPIVSSGNLLNDMQTYSPALYSQYRSGKKMQTTGWILLGTGAAATFFGVVLLADADPVDDELYLYGTTALTIAGIACLATSVPMLIIGGGKKSRAVGNFNRQFQLTQHATPHFQMNVYPNRVGLAYVF